jgi:hypothetical protein
MGVWGPAIFSDDIAADTRDRLIDLLSDGLPVELATQELMDESDEILNDPDESIVFWIALAATQSKLGRLMDSVRDKAVEIIDSGADLRRWKNDGARTADIRRRRVHLTKLRRQLLGPQPKPRRLKRVEKSATDFQQGDVFVFRLGEHLSMRFCVLGIFSDRELAHICFLGLDRGERTKIEAVLLKDTFGPHYLMVGHEPSDRITILYRGIPVPDPRDLENIRAWNQRRHIGAKGCEWPDFARELLADLVLRGSS